MKIAAGRSEVFKTAKQMITSSRDVVGEQCVQNEQGDIVVQYMTN